MSDIIYTRVPWSADFPDVIIHNQLEKRNNHPDFSAAKAGDMDAAFRLVLDLFDFQNARKELKYLADHFWDDGNPPILAAVSALEPTGFNAIPDAMAEFILDCVDVDADPGEIRQINKVGHTKSGGWHRFVTQAEFEGEIQKGRSYILVDDHIGFGGTLANLRGFIEQNGGQVIVMTTLTETSGAKRIALQKTTLNMLFSKHGEELEQFWKEIFGYGLECLTELEASYLCRQPSIDRIRGRLAEAAEKASQLGLWPVEIPELPARPE